MLQRLYESDPTTCCHDAQPWRLGIAGWGGFATKKICGGTCNRHYSSHEVNASRMTSVSGVSGCPGYGRSASVHDLRSLRGGSVVILLITRSERVAHDFRVRRLKLSAPTPPIQTVRRWRQVVPALPVLSMCGDGCPRAEATTTTKNVVLGDELIMDAVGGRRDHAASRPNRR